MVLASSLLGANKPSGRAAGFEASFCGAVFSFLITSRDRIAAPHAQFLAEIDQKMI